MSQLVKAGKWGVTSASMNEVYDELGINYFVCEGMKFTVDHVNVIYEKLGSPHEASPGESIQKHVDRINMLLFEGATPATPTGDRAE